MDLKTYRESRKWTLEQLATLVSGNGLHADASLVRKHEIGRHIPRPEMIERYELLTDGAITVATFMEQRRRWLATPEGKEWAEGKRRARLDRERRRLDRETESAAA